VIGCTENCPQHLALPRGCLEPVQTLLREQHIGWKLVDERQNGSPLKLYFTGQLRPDQEAAVEAMIHHDIGVLQAPTAFGKTVVAAAIATALAEQVPNLFLLPRPPRAATLVGETAAGPMLLYRKLDSAMQVVSFSEARESFKAVLDRVEADADVTLITRRHAQGAVVMSLDTYNSLMETVHLLRSPANAAHLQRSLEQAERGELLSHLLIDADPFDADPLDADS
jgi:antitoxin YefM